MIKTREPPAPGEVPSGSGSIADQRDKSKNIAPLKASQRTRIDRGNCIGLDLRQLALRLGGEVVGSQVVAPGPGHSLRDRSLSVWLSDVEGFVVYSHAGDDWRACREHVLRRVGGSYRPFPNVLRPPATPRRQNVEKKHRAIAMWNQAQDPQHTLAETHLKLRGLEVPIRLLNHIIRFEPNCPWIDETSGEMCRVPAMIAAFRKIDDDAIVGVQRTRLSAAGTKIDRRMLGPTSGAAIKIDPDVNVTGGLTIGEGLETCIAGLMFGYRPIWAVGSARGIANFPVLAGIESLSILAEFEDGGANARAIAQCRSRWLAAGREVLVVSPMLGNDINDALRGG